MAENLKGKSPFYPGQPVPVEFFAGRTAQIERIVIRGVAQVSQGKPMAFFIEGEYGIGKNSFANFTQWIAEKDHGLHPIYVTLGGCRTLDDVANAVLESTVRSGAMEPHRLEKLGDWIGKYIGKQELFGVSLNLDALRRDAPSISTPFGLLSFLGQMLGRLKETGTKGVYLVLDEINGITANEDFAHFIKAVVDTNAMQKTPLPLLLVLGGVQERRREMIQRHQPVDRIFDVVTIEPMTPKEMETFFIRAFESVQMTVDEDALALMTHYSAGFPKIMHLIGDAAYWMVQSGKIVRQDALMAVLNAADEVGKKYVDQQVYKALRSKDYRAILSKIGKLNPDSMSFMKKEAAAGLTEPQRKKLNNFLQKMKALKVLRSGDIQGEYVFNLRMVRLYIWLQTLGEAKE